MADVLLVAVRRDVVVAVPNVEEVERVTVARLVHEPAGEGEVLRLDGSQVARWRHEQGLGELLRQATLRVERRRQLIGGEHGCRHGAGSRSDARLTARQEGCDRCDSRQGGVASRLDGER